MKIMALDLGDVWVGIAISDPLGIIASPYKTVLRGDLEQVLVDIISQQKIGTLVIGDPKTMRGTESLQTSKTRTYAHNLEQMFPDTRIVLWDERLSSKRAGMLNPGIITKEQKREAHARAAAFILNSYLEHCHMHRANGD